MGEMMHVALKSGTKETPGKSGYATKTKDGQRHIFHSRKIYEVDPRLGAELLGTGFFRTAAPDAKPDPAKRARAESLVDKLAGMSSAQMERFEALLSASQSGATAAPTNGETEKAPKKRGRPPKQKADADTEEKAPAKKRGRPPKKTLAAAQPATE